MAIITPDKLVPYLSGASSHGVEQTDPKLSLGGFRSNTIKNKAFLLKTGITADIQTIVLDCDGWTAADFERFSSNPYGPHIFIDDEFILVGAYSYSNVNTVTLTGCTRGFWGTTASIHFVGAMGRTVSPVGYKLFENVSSADATAGRTYYRCTPFVNTSAAILINMTFYVGHPTGNASDVCSFAVEVNQNDDVTGSAQTIADEFTAPTVNGSCNGGAGYASNWSTATTKANGVTIDLGAHSADLGPGAQVFIWERRIITAGAASAQYEKFSIKYSYDSDQT